MTMLHDASINLAQKLFGLGLGLLLIVLSGCDGQETIIEDLSQKDALMALMLMQQNKIPAQKEAHANKRSTTYTIKVKKSQATMALRILMENHIPKNERPGLREVFSSSSSGLIPSKSDEIARLALAMQGEAEALLRVIPGIIDVRVVYSLEVPNDFRGQGQKKSASVVLVYQPQRGSVEGPLNEEEIQNLVASSFGNLLPSDVKVVQKVLPEVSHITQPEAATTRLLGGADDKNKFQWLLIGVTILALMLASYGVFRLYWLRRA